MTLTEAIAVYTRPDVEDRSPLAPIQLLQQYVEERTVEDAELLSEAQLRDFLANWYVSNYEAGRRNLPEPADLISSLEKFFIWMEAVAAPEPVKTAITLLNDLRESLPRAIQISALLAEHVAGQGGPVFFPEFLSSFEEGGRSQYDIDSTAEPGALEGYFRLLAVSGARAQAEEIITQRRVGPIIFPEAVSPLLARGYIMNLEVIRTELGWRITSCGPVFPPGTDVVR